MALVNLGILAMKNWRSWRTQAMLVASAEMKYPFDEAPIPTPSPLALLGKENGEETRQPLELGDDDANERLNVSLTHGALRILLFSH
ncbi:hypothetical protein OsI_11962 [Oryza sativa Indica Group]|uniref:Uncharacterized protein n=1 Tax=Oryza sativa subsp. indica TaxID=39946 RepID=A2XHS4_ORYSI|nr:hypothetical protein OsI_11962 [Oryza sativa Indica Group]